MLVKRSKEEQEEFLVREFLEQQDVRVHNLERLSQRIPEHDRCGIAGPDIWATVDWQGNSLEVAFELTDYYLDLDSRGSVSMRRKDIWNDVCHYIQMKHSDATVLKKLHVAVSFTSHLPAKGDVVALADELASFLLSHLPAEGCEAHFCPCGYRQCAGDFEQYPLLRAHFQRVNVWNTDYEVNERLWHCADAAIIGVSAAEIARIVQEKTERFPQYNLAGADECWLLICAGGKSSSNRAGLRGTPLAALNEEVLAAVEQTPFHKIIFWDRIDGEYVEIGSRS
ncbi:MAG: hypothetical protein ACYC4U_18375 [Pirellulaceae bacterium]